VELRRYCSWMNSTCLDGALSSARKSRTLVSLSRQCLSDQLPVLEPVRLGRVGSFALDKVGVVVLEVALEPPHLAVVLERQHVGRDAIEEPAVVADHDHAAGKAQ